MRKLLKSLHLIGCGVPMITLRFADGGGSGTGTGDGAGTGDGKGTSTAAGSQTTGTGDGAGDGAGKEEKKFTQTDIDDAVEKRLARERKKWEREQQKQQQATQTAQQSASGTGDGTQQQAAQQTQQPKDDSAEKIAKVNRRLVAAEAKTAAIAAGAKPDRADYVVRLADLSKVDVDEDDGPDTDAIKKAIDKVLKDMPEFKATPDDGKNGGSGFQQIGADGSTQGAHQQTQQQVQTTPTATKRWNKFRQF